MNNRLQGNYHTHTRLCKHADGEPVDYAAHAVLKGLKALGFSDHTPYPDHRWNHVRMDYDALPVYFAWIDAAREAYPDLEIFAGLECEFDPACEGFYRDELLGHPQVDYLVYAPHWFPSRGGWADCFREARTAAHLRDYTRNTLAALSTGLFAFMAHPDLYGSSYPVWDESAEACARDICAAAARFNVPLEINGLGFRRTRVQGPEGSRPPYPWPPFWEVAAEYDVAVTINSDAHQPGDVAGNMEDALRLADRYCLRVIDLKTRLVRGVGASGSSRTAGR